MNLIDLIDTIQKADPEFDDRISPRRHAIKSITGFGIKVTMAALPFVFGTIFKKAYGGTTPANVNDALNVILTAEYLEAAYYNTYISKTYIPVSDLPGLRLIQADENNHVKFLQSLLGTGANPSPVFDFTGGSGAGNGSMSGIETSYNSFLALAQLFEDVGVRIGKGQVTALMGNASILANVFNMHSVKARHAAFIRKLRQSSGVDIKPWITGVKSEISAMPAIPAYVNEDNTTQNSENVATVVPADATTEAFDEPLDRVGATTFLSLFIKP